MRNRCNVSVSFPARKLETELKIVTKTWDILRATYSIALLHISNENTAYLVEISRHIKYFEIRNKHLSYDIKGGYVWSLAIALRQGRTPSFFISSFGFPYDRQYIDKVWKKSIERIFFSGEWFQHYFMIYGAKRLTEIYKNDTIK